MVLEKANENKEKFRSNLSEAARGKWEPTSEEPKGIINNIKML